MTFAVIPFGAMRQSRAISVTAADGAGIWGWNDGSTGSSLGSLPAGNRTPIVVNGIHVTFVNWSYGTNPDSLNLGLRPYPYSDSLVSTALAAQALESLEISGATKSNGKYLRTSASVSVSGAAGNRYVLLQWTLADGAAPTSGNYTATVR